MQGLRRVNWRGWMCGTSKRVRWFWRCARRNAPLVEDRGDYVYDLAFLIFTPYSKTCAFGAFMPSEDTMEKKIPTALTPEELQKKWESIVHQSSEKMTKVSTDISCFSIYSAYTQGHITSNSESYSLRGRHA